MILFETALKPRLYVDPSLVRTDLLSRSAPTGYCNYKGYATYWSFKGSDGEGEVVDDVAWSYDDPLLESLPIKGMSSFDETKLDVLAELPQSAR